MEVNASQDQQHSPPCKGTVLQWDWMLVFIAEETCHVQALRSVCRDTVTEATTVVPSAGGHEFKRCALLGLLRCESGHVILG